MFHTKLLVLGLFSLLIGCATPAERVDREAANSGLERFVLVGTDFPHIVYRNHGSLQESELHVYLEGDGTPWIQQRWISSDPTPRNPLMLRLMTMDSAPSIYLGRPCYHGFASTPPCNPTYWTQKRFSETVIASMAAVLRKLLESGRHSSVVFMGHSGGGTLAMLLAEIFPESHTVVTLSGNLDTDAWTTYHGYTTLDGSLNPARRPPLSTHIKQLHFVGTQDSRVPATLVLAVVQRQPNYELLVIDGFTHTCCWKEIWPQILERLHVLKVVQSPTLDKKFP